MNNILIAPDSFKGTLSAEAFCRVVERAVRAHCPAARVTALPLSDGGEGMVDCYLRICGGERVYAEVCGPNFKKVRAAYGMLPTNTAVIEMAACAGLPLADPQDPRQTTTYGVGELILHAAARGAREVLLGLGGSATNDGGMGMAAALGYRFLDEAGSELAPVGDSLTRVARIERPDGLPGIRLRAACDVDNPLTGPEGAAHFFGAHKGADAAARQSLDDGLRSFAAVIQRDLGADVETLRGAGAAGGLGAGAVAFLDGELHPGIDLLLGAARFDALLETASLVFTGEGRMDGQSARGKVPSGVAHRARAKGVPVIALCGSLGDGADAMYGEGVTAMFSTLRGFTNLEGVTQTGERDLYALADAVLRLLTL